MIKKHSDSSLGIISYVLANRDNGWLATEKNVLEQGRTNMNERTCRKRLDMLTASSSLSDSDSNRTVRNALVPVIFSRLQAQATL